MTQNERELSNLSYTNKDFGQIYPELLDLAKRISYKWDPSSSDESDPGVVLLKLCALMADKNNYNIDKNILELFPLSVTQLANAREIFDQCGYTMKYYNSATTNINMNITEEPEITETDASNWNIDESLLSKAENVRTYTIPQFTMFSDVDNEIVYTSIEEQHLKSTGGTVGIAVMEGKIVDYDINGETLITSAHLDYNNRLYFPSLDVAENGIFISSDNKNWVDWKKVDNLTIQRLGTYCYKFGLSHSGSSCYIEFPSDIDTLIGNGIYIKYIISSGVEGNIGARGLRQLYTDITVERTIDSSYNVNHCTLTNDNVYISNTLPATNGKNPETIDSAYRNYQKIKTTFDTLVSLQDYTNFLYSNELVSNGFVCDRTNDPQSAYEIIEGTNSYDKTHIVQEDTLALDAFALRIYGLTYVEDPTGNLTRNIDTTFDVISWDKAVVADYAVLLGALEDVKSIAHDIKTPALNVPFMYKNRFDIKCTIMPQYSLTDAQKKEVVYAVKYALCKVLNARAIDFGEEADFDLIYTTISEADPRIKAVSIDTPEYKTYAVYMPSENVIKEMRIDSNSMPPVISESEEGNNNNDVDLWKEFRLNIVAKSILAGRTPLFTSKTNFEVPVLQQYPEKISAISLSTSTNLAMDKKETTSLATYELKENENVILTAKNLITYQTYGSYVKYVQSLKSDVVRDHDYQLTGDDFIAFFWKKEDGDDIPYSYFKYTALTVDPKTEELVNIICPSIKLQAKQSDLTYSDDASNFTMDALREYIKTLPSGTGTLSSSVVIDNKDKTAKIYVEDAIAAIRGTNYALTGEAQIVTKKPNAIEVSPIGEETSIFWILNRSSGEQATLFAKNETSYTLDSNEYLFYTNSSRTQLIALGAGTIIERKNNSKNYEDAWNCTAITYDDLVSNGFISYLNGEKDGTDKWFTVNDNEKLLATEQQYYQLGPKTQLKIRNENVTGTLTVKSDGLYLDNDKIDDTTGYTFGYVDSESSSTDETWLPNKNTKDLQWNIRSLLNIDISNITPMSLENHQTMTATTADSKEKQLTGNIFVDNPITTVGGNNVDVRYYNIDNLGYEPRNFYSYQQPNISDDSWISFTGTTVNLTTKKEETLTSDTKFKLLAGKYLIPIVIDSDVALTTLTLDCILPQLDESQNPKRDDDNNIIYDHVIASPITVKQSGTSYNILELDADIEFQLYIDVKATLPEGKETLTIKLLPLHSYELTDNLLYSDNSDDEFFIGKVFEKTQTLDTKQYFNYTYDVPEDIRIDNPLEATSFFKKAHIYNKFTIAQWSSQSKESEYKIMNKIR